MLSEHDEGDPSRYLVSHLSSLRARLKYEIHESEGLLKQFLIEGSHEAFVKAVALCTGLSERYSRYVIVADVDDAQWECALPHHDTWEACYEYINQLIYQAVVKNQLSDRGEMALFLLLAQAYKQLGVHLDSELLALSEPWHSEAHFNLDGDQQQGSYSPDDGSFLNNPLLPTAQREPNITHQFPLLAMDNIVEQGCLGQLVDVYFVYKGNFNPQRLIEVMMQLHQGVVEQWGGDLSMEAYREEVRLLMQPVSTLACLDLYRYFSNKDTSTLMRTLITAFQCSQPLSWAPYLSVSQKRVIRSVYDVMDCVMSAVREALLQRGNETAPYFRDIYPETTSPAQRNRQVIEWILMVYDGESIRTRVPMVPSKRWLDEQKRKPLD